MFVYISSRTLKGAMPNYQRGDRMLMGEVNGKWANRRQDVVNVTVYIVSYHNLPLVR